MPKQKIPHYLHSSGHTAIGTPLSSYGREIILVNPENRSYTQYRGHRKRGNAYVLWFGACAATYLMVWEDHLESALESAIDWIAEHAPGLLADKQVADAYNEAIAEGKSEDEARDEAETDTTYVDPGHYLPSWEWGIALENPTRQELAEFIGHK